jgi:hypothetical protein
MRTDGRTDMKLTVTICSFTKANKNELVLLTLQCRSRYTVDRDCIYDSYKLRTFYLG